MDAGESPLLILDKQEEKQIVFNSYSSPGEAFSEEGGSAFSHSLHIFTAFLGSNPLKSHKNSTVDKWPRSRIRHLDFRPPDPCCSLPSPTVWTRAQWRSLLSVAVLCLLHFFFHPASKDDEQMETSEEFNDLQQIGLSPSVHHRLWHWRPF